MELKKIIFITTIILLIHQAGISQTNPDSSKIILKISAGESNIKLRWAANNPTLWKSCLNNGFSIERYTISRNGETLDEREKKIVVKQIKPAPLKDWEIAAKDNEYAAIIAQAIYGDSFEVTGMKTNDLQGMVNQTLELEQRYNFALYCADLNFEAACLAGWAFSDNDVIPDECYLYRIIPLDSTGSHSVSIQYGFDHTCMGNTVELPRPIQLHAEFGDKSAMLYWNNDLMKHFFTAYQIEKSTDNQNFTPLGKPFVALGDETNGEVMCLDSLQENNLTYYYRIRGIDAFGKIGPPSDTIQGMGMPVLKYIPQIIHAQANDDGSANVEWVFDENGNNEIRSFSLLQSDRSNGEYHPLINHIPKEIRNIHFKELLPVNYLVIVAEPHIGKTTSSHPYMLIAPDSIPPAAPFGLSAIADTSGIVQLKWVDNTEADLEGYKIYKYNHPEEEPIVVCDSIFLGTNFTDSIDLYNLNPYIYYTVKAFDRRYNQSEFSIPLKVEKPLKTQPSSPVFTSYKVENDGIFLEWINSPDEICVRHLLYRKEKDSLNFIAIKSFEGKEISSYKDLSVNEGKSYCYYMVSQTKWNVESLPSPTIELVSLSQKRPELIQKIQSKWIREDRKIQLSWNVSKPEIISSYRMYRSENNAPLSLWKETSERIISDNQTKTGYTYRYAVQAICTDGRLSQKKEITHNSMEN